MLSINEHTCRLPAARRQYDTTGSTLCAIIVFLIKALLKRTVFGQQVLTMSVSHITDTVSCVQLHTYYASSAYAFTTEWYVCADWVEHALDTKAEPYLMTPEGELSFVVRHNLDVIATVAFVVHLLLCFTHKPFGRLVDKLALKVWAWLVLVWHEVAQAGRTLHLRWLVAYIW